MGVSWGIAYVYPRGIRFDSPPCCVGDLDHAVGVCSPGVVVHGQPRLRTDIHHTRRIAILLGVLWALPCSVVGALLGIVIVALGGSARRVDHTIEVALAVEQPHTSAWARQLRFSAITLGHVIVGQSHEAVAARRAHERVPVRQYGLFGALFFVAFPGASVWALIRGRCLYRGNHFEKQAFAQAPAPTQAA